MCQRPHFENSSGLILPKHEAIFTLSCLWTYRLQYAEGDWPFLPDISGPIQILGENYFSQTHALAQV